MYEEGGRIRSDHSETPWDTGGEVCGLNQRCAFDESDEYYFYGLYLFQFSLSATLFIVMLANV